MNEFEQRIRSGETVYGSWQAPADPLNDIRSMLAQIQAVTGYDHEPVARLP